ncbi:MAG: glycoside hydrolase [Sphingobacteriaceae bacterium]|jgi:GH43 family beta-xylosidase|nr:glycoside hydrolase [Sphingobacteriaceae bacterium]
MRITRFALFPVALLLSVSACFTNNAAVDKSVTSTDTAKYYFKNPIGKGADPWVVKSGKYYYTCQTGQGGITVRKSEKLTVLGSPKLVWKPPVNSWNSTCIWAPELHHIGKKWYIYYAAGQSGPPYIYQRSGVLESVTHDPQGAYIDKGMLKTGDDPADPSKTIWAIDVNVFQVNGGLYAVWSGWKSNAPTDKTSQHLYIARMANPWTISSERVKISSPEEPWETGGPLNLNEGPEFLKHNGKAFIIYSTRESWTPQYRLGQLALQDSTKSLLNAGNWKKSGPVFEGTPEVLGVGHASFTTSPDGKEWWIFYHSKIESKPGWNRDLRLQQFFWDASGNPVFGTPLPAGTLIRKPSGE